jgi:hypothetical protein
MVSPWQKKNRQAFGWRFLGFGSGSSLAGPFRQQAEEMEEAKKPEGKLRKMREPARHRSH